MKKLLFLLMAVVAFGLSMSAQNRTITGQVLFEGDHEPLAGASVIPMGQTRGVVTDIDGNFAIQVAPSVRKLTISYVGMIPQDVEVPTDGKSLKIYLKDKENILDEVMVVAYGTVKKAEYTGSASVVKGDALETVLVDNVTKALDGRMAGVQTLSSNGQPGTAAAVYIRGVGSINASTSPLYVVDGMPYDGDISSIAATDIESLTVLKDAASTALYGARGANGVILITTKKGQQGKAKIDVDMRWGSSWRAVPQYDVITDQRQFLETAYQALYNTNYNTSNDAVSAHNYANNMIWSALGYQTWTVPEGQNAFSTDGKFNPNATPGYSNGRYYFIADDWEKGSLRHGFRQDYSLSITGGTEKLNYYIAGSYLEDQGIIQGSHFKRLSTRTTIDYQAYDWLKIGTMLNYTYSNTAYPDDNTNTSSTSSGNVFYFVNGLGPVYPMYVRNPDGTIMYNNIYNHPIYDYGDGADYGNGVMFASRTPMGNPTSQLLYDKTDYLADILDGKWYASITPVDGLNVTGTISYFVNNTRLHEVLNPLYGQFASMGGEAVQYASRDRSLQAQVIASYNHTFNDVHNFDIMFGYESQDFRTEYTEALGDNLYNPNNWTVNNTIDNKKGFGAEGHLTHRGWLGRLKYNYAGKYYLMASFRRDGSSRFSPDHRWGTFWSASAGWDIKKENFLKEVTWMDLLKFKISFGQNGNDGIGTNYLAYADQYIMTGADGVFADGTLYYKGNKDITWEKSNSFNTGFDFAFFNGKLTGTIEYYSRATEDMLMYVPVAPSLGYSSIPMNVGSMRNYGFELDLNYRLFDTKNVIWDVFANMTLPRNKVTKLEKSILDEDGYWWRSTYQFAKEGESLYQWALPSYAGVDEYGNALYWAKDENGEEVKTTNWVTARTTNKKETGSTMPKGYGGFGTSVKAFGFDLTAQFAYQFGGRIIDYGYQNLMQAGTNLGQAWHKDVLDAWTPENSNSNVPALYTGTSQAGYNYAISMSDRWLISSNYLSLNNITLGYTIPSKLCRKIGLTSIRIYGAGENVALWSKRKGMDPRQSFWSSENRTYCPMRTFTGGLHVEF